jgi:succinate dehydrogenase iron-sulfur subunit
MESLSPIRTITFRLQRYDPEQDAAPGWEVHHIPVAEGVTVLEALHTLKEDHAPTLAWRSSCRMGICGSCGMCINGLPRLACQTQVLHLNSDIVEIASLPNHPIVKDLVPNLRPMFDRHQAVRPYLLSGRAEADGGEAGRVDGEYLQSPQQREAYSQFTYCITCGLCLSACPTSATDPHFLGPQALAQALRYTADNRDAGLAGRVDVLDVLHGPYQCHLSGACTEVCPKGVDPALGVQLLKRELSLAALGLRRRPPGASSARLAGEYVPNDKIAKPPARTVP